jgi:hypothetical protein
MYVCSNIPGFHRDFNIEALETQGDRCKSEGFSRRVCTAPSSFAHEGTVLARVPGIGELEQRMRAIDLRQKRLAGAPGLLKIITGKRRR